MRLSPFNVFTDLQTFDDAISACESVGTSLVVIENAHVQEALECLLSKRQLNGNNPYINVYKSNGEFTTADGEPLTFSNWADGEPKGYGNCGAIRGAGDHKWEDGPCDRKRMYICDGKVNDLTQADKDRFHVYTDKLTFDEAVAACESKGATLAVVKNPLVQDYLSNYLYENGLSPENPYINVYNQTVNLQLWMGNR
ncbi:mannose-binding protein C-like [Ptychodera flava]|uniref:mannose-binding protein C-like n=1 Tax=Ptychodera flava TaxID=63121 RepID=UPI00396A0E2B